MRWRRRAAPLRPELSTDPSGDDALVAAAQAGGSELARLLAVRRWSVLTRPRPGGSAEPYVVHPPGAGVCVAVWSPVALLQRSAAPPGAEQFSQTAVLSGAALAARTGPDLGWLVSLSATQVVLGPDRVREVAALG